jgi:hypothetical protein
LPRVKSLTAETLHEIAGMLGIGEAIDVEPLIVMENGMAAGGRALCALRTEPPENPEAGIGVSA